MRKMIAATLTVALAASMLAGCGGSSSSTSTTAAATTAAATEAAKEEAAETEGAAEASDGDVVGNAASDPVVTFNVTNTHSGEGVQDSTMNLLIELTDKYSGGTIQGTKIAGGSLGGEREETEMIQLGTLEVGLISDMGIDSAIGGLGWAWLPFMLTDYDMVDEYYINGWISDELTAQMAAQGIVRVAATENEFRQCANVKHAIESIDDFKGLKIRVPETKACQDFYTAIGAIPASIATSETLAALEQGTVDGVDNSIYNMKSMGILEDVKYVTLMNYMYAGASIVCSEDFWGSMTADQQAAFTKAATEAGAYFRENMRADTKTILGQYDFEVYEIETGSDFYNDLKAAAVGLWEQYKTEYDADIMEKILSDFSV